MSFIISLSLSLCEPFRFTVCNYFLSTPFVYIYILFTLCLSHLKYIYIYIYIKRERERGGGGREYTNVISVLANQTPYLVYKLEIILHTFITQHMYSFEYNTPKRLKKFLILLSTKWSSQLSALYTQTNMNPYSTNSITPAIGLRSRLKRKT